MESHTPRGTKHTVFFNLFNIFLIVSFLYHAAHLVFGLWLYGFPRLYAVLVALPPPPPGPLCRGELSAGPPLAARGVDGRPPCPRRAPRHPRRRAPRHPRRRAAPRRTAGALVARPGPLPAARSPPPGGGEGVSCPHPCMPSKPTDTRLGIALDDPLPAVGAAALRSAALGGAPSRIVSRWLSPPTRIPRKPFTLLENFFSWSMVA